MLEEENWKESLASCEMNLSFYIKDLFWTDFYWKESDLSFATLVTCLYQYQACSKTKRDSTKNEENTRVEAISILSCEEIPSK